MKWEQRQQPSTGSKVTIDDGSDRGKKMLCHVIYHFAKKGDGNLCKHDDACENVFKISLSFPIPLFGMRVDFFPYLPTFFFEKINKKIHSTIELL